MNISIQGQQLEIKVEACRLKDKEMFGSHEYYVCIEYANSRFRTRTSTHGGKNPTFKEKFQIPLFDGLRELTITVWNEHKNQDTHIGTAIVPLHRVLCEGDDDTSWPIQSTHDKYAGEVNLVMHLSGASPPSAPHGPPPPYPFVYPHGGGYPYPAPPYHFPAYPGPGYPYQYGAYPPAHYQQYGPPYPPPPAPQPPYYQPPGPGPFPPPY